MLREECTQSLSWWEDVQNHHNESTNSTSFYHKNSSNNNNSTANASCEEDNLSISTVHRLDLTAESSNHHSLSAPDQPPPPSDDALLRDHVVSSHNHLWSLAFMDRPGRNIGDQMMDHHHMTSSRNSSTTSELPSFESPWGNGWIYDTDQVRYDQSNEQRLSKLTDLVGKHWSIAPPNNPDMNHNLHQHDHHFGHNNHSQTNEDVSIYRQSLEVKNEEDLCYNNGSNGGGLVFHDQIENSRSFLRLSRSLTDTNNPSFKPCFKALNLSEFNSKKEHQATSLAPVRLGTTNAGKKKRCEEVSDEVSKKAKCGGGSTLSPEKELPKAKLRDKITTLQQIVSPFGKTDTASVLQEAITYINFYQEQVKLLSTPYMKNSSIKDPWGGWEREDYNKRGQKQHIDLRSRGLCLVPISCTPISYQDNTATEYWSPSYRGSLYR